MPKIIGIPQNRERVFIVSIRQDIDKGTFCFPQKEQLLLKLKDLLETNVDNKYYLTEKGIGKILKKKNKIISLSPTLVDISRGTFKQPIILVAEGGKKSYSVATIGDSINISYPNNINKRGRVGKQIAQTITTTSTIATLEMFNSCIQDIIPTQETVISNATSNATVLISEDNRHGLRIRRLTPLECFRLMGYDDSDFYKARNIGISDTQLYKQCRK